MCYHALICFVVPIPRGYATIDLIEFGSLQSRKLYLGQCTPMLDRVSAYGLAGLVTWIAAAFLVMQNEDMVNVDVKNGCATVIFEKEYILVPRVFLKLKPRWTLENGMIITTVDKTVFGNEPTEYDYSTQPCMCFPYVQVERWRAGGGVEQEIIR